jgi:hypothetical protein
MCYMKPTASGRIFNFNSNHSMRLKVNTATGLIKRVFGLSPIKSDEEKSTKVATILRRNSYPKGMVNKLINEYKHKSSINVNPEENANAIAPASVPYIRLSEPICRKITELSGGKTLGISSNRSMARIFSKLKD